MNYDFNALGNYLSSLSDADLKRYIKTAKADMEYWKDTEMNEPWLYHKGEHDNVIRRHTFAKNILSGRKVLPPYRRYG